MARRRRAVERASLRQTVTDRIIVVLIAVVAASGSMSLLPGSGQAAVRRAVCQAGSLGLSSCSRSTLALGAGRLGPPRCAVLAALDDVLPEVQVSRMVSPAGLPVEVSSARSGRITLRLGTQDSAAPPEPLTGERRKTRALLPGAEVPVAAEWTLPSDQGADAVVDAVADAHQVWVTGRSSLATLFAVLGGDQGDIPAPTVRYSRVRLDRRVLPGVAVPSTPATPPKATKATKAKVDTSTKKQDRTGKRAARVKAPANWIRIDSEQPAVLQFDRVDQQSAVVAATSGVVAGEPVSGWIRWTRDRDGNVRDVLLALVSPRALVRGEPAPLAGEISVSYLAVPVRTAPEQQLAQGWLSDASGFHLDLDQVLRLAPVDTSNQLTAFLSRAASVTTLHHAGADLSTARTRIFDELVTLRRQEPEGFAVTFAGRVDPQPGGSARTLVVDRACAR